MEDLHQRPGGLFALGNEPHGREDVLALMDAAEQPPRQQQTQLAVFDRAQRLQLAGVEDGTAAQNKMVTRAREIFSRNPAESAKRLSDVHDRWLDIFGKALGIPIEAVGPCSRAPEFASTEKCAQILSPDFLDVLRGTRRGVLFGRARRALKGGHKS